MSLQTDFLERCIATFDKAYSKLLEVKPETLDYEIYRSACVKEFEIILEQSGKLLKKAIVPFFHRNKEVDQLYFKDVFRNAAKHGLISIEEAERWLEYRDNRNLTAHDYGVGFAEETIKLIPEFVSDALTLVIALKKWMLMLIREKDRLLLSDIFSSFDLSNCEVFAYGSRVNNKAHEASDLDLVIKSNNNTPINACILTAIRVVDTGHLCPF